jgi:hypothetical protein
MVRMTKYVIIIFFCHCAGACRKDKQGTKSVGDCNVNTYVECGFAHLQYVVDQELLQVG